MIDPSERLYPVLTREQLAAWAAEVKLHAQPKPLTIADYLDETRFPLTTVTGLDVERQMTIDAFDLAAMEQESACNGSPSDEQTARLKELREKAKYRAQFLEELARSEKKEAASATERQPKRGPGRRKKGDGAGDSVH